MPWLLATRKCEVKVIRVTHASYELVEIERDSATNTYARYGQGSCVTWEQNLNGDWRTVKFPEVLEAAYQEFLALTGGGK